ncbi:hypothetical protein [Spirosoma horti]
MTVEQIQQAIAALSAEEYNQLSTWLTEHDFSRWDDQIVTDINAGRLDGLIDEVKQEQQSGLTSPL